jgi:hypothetical protein
LKKFQQCGGLKKEQISSRAFYSSSKLRAAAARKGYYPEDASSWW